MLETTYTSSAPGTHVGPPLDELAEVETLEELVVEDTLEECELVAESDVLAETDEADELDAPPPPVSGLGNPVRAPHPIRRSAVTNVSGAAKDESERRMP